MNSSLVFSHATASAWTLPGASQSPLDKLSLELQAYGFCRPRQVSGAEWRVIINKLFLNIPVLLCSWARGQLALAHPWKFGDLLWPKKHEQK